VLQLLCTYVTRGDDVPCTPATRIAGTHLRVDPGIELIDAER
jgi:hypothetical protein